MISNRINAFRKSLYLVGSNSLRTKKHLDKWDNSLKNPKSYYIEAFKYFRLYLDKRLVNHRKYFQTEKRGFGEEAFHVLWYLLYNRFKFEAFLEIGVYRGQVMSLVALLAQINKRPIFIQGISPFDKSGDTVSKYLDINYIDDINKNFSMFSLPPPKLCNAYSTDKVATDLIKSREWDCIYIDGSHDYEIVLKDWDLCSENITLNGIIVIDDASLYTNFDNPFFAFKGHPGPSKVADRIASSTFKEILRVGHNRVFQRVK